MKTEMGGEPICLTFDLLAKLEADAFVPTPKQAISRLIELCGKRQDGYGGSAPINGRDCRALLGLRDSAEFGYIVMAAVDSGLIELLPNGSQAPPFDGLTSVRLTPIGWEQYESELNRPMERVGFMAMEFGDSDLDLAFETCFKVGVAQAGFRLERLDEIPRPGLIDIHLRESIRKASFVLADLTTQNLGAYFEAGLAEGLGKPVIYLCREPEWNERRTHFDVNHHATVIWNPDRLDEAAESINQHVQFIFGV